MTTPHSERPIAGPPEPLAPPASSPATTGRRRLPGLHASRSALRRGGGAVTATALAAGLVVGVPTASQAQQSRSTPQLGADRATAVTHLSPVQQRLSGVMADLGRAVAAGDVTSEQARVFYRKLARRISAEPTDFGHGRSSV